MKPRDFFAVFPEPDELTTQVATQDREWHLKNDPTCRCLHKAIEHDQYGCRGRAGMSLCKCARTREQVMA